jgi:outer membrane protein assembly factor BamB
VPKPCLRIWTSSVFLLALVISWLPAANWPHWRGPEGTGHSSEKDLPVRWDAQSVTWKVALEGKGQSSPVIWGERIFLTSALEGGRQRLVFCLDRRDGKPLWKHVAWKGDAVEKTHAMNSHATPTCATDGEVVAAFFGRGGLHGYTVDGKHLWSRDLGPFAGPWGTAASPVIFGDMVIQNCDAENDAYLLAVDKRTGKTVWKTPRDVPERGGWSTPVLVQAGNRQELVLNGAKLVTAYDPATGKVLWTCKTFNGRGEPTATPGNGLVYMLNGLAGDFYAIRPGGSGDVTRSHMAWHTPRKGARDQPSPIVIGNHVLVMDMKGTLTCYAADTGKELWKERVAPGNYTSSPIAANGLAYFQNDAGETTVVKPGPKLEVVATNKIRSASDEIFRASLTPCDEQMFIRSDRALYCVGTRKETGTK